MKAPSCARSIGDYNRKIEIHQISSSASADAHGFVDITSAANWETLTDTWAAIQTKGGREFWKIDRVESDVSHVWFCPYSTTLATATPKMRVRYEGNDYEIVSVVNIDEANVEIEIQTKRAVT